MSLYPAFDDSVLDAWLAGLPAEAFDKVIAAAIQVAAPELADLVAKVRADERRRLAGRVEALIHEDCRTATTPCRRCIELTGVVARVRTP